LSVPRKHQLTQLSIVLFFVLAMVKARDERQFSGG
jgi:hypothetical protein